jgi:hypothetical protein
LVKPLYTTEVHKPGCGLHVRDEATAKLTENEPNQESVAEILQRLEEMF